MDGIQSKSIKIFNRRKNKTFVTIFQTSGLLHLAFYPLAIMHISTHLLAQKASPHCTKIHTSPHKNTHFDTHIHTPKLT
jgi:hypothetical protein